MHTGFGIVACGALVVLIGSCWRPRNNAGHALGWQTPGWERGPLAAASARAGAALQVEWDGDGFPVSIVGVASDPDGQELVSDVISEQTLEELSDRLTREPSVDAGLDVTRLLRLREDRCLQILDGGLVEGDCAPDAL